MTVTTSPAKSYLRASHAEFGDLFAAWDIASHHVEPGIRSSRFAARLAPFPSREEAERALIAEGAVIELDQPQPLRGAA